MTSREIEHRRRAGNERGIETSTLEHRGGVWHEIC